MGSTLFAPYGESLSHSLRKYERIMENCLHDFSHHSRNTVSSTLSRLKKQGLVSIRGPKKKARWLITKRGKQHFRRAKDSSTLPQEDGKIRLVVFDIPEKIGGQRAWLRSRLAACDYRQLQKSVWMGTRPLPKELFDELRERKLFPFVHVVGLEVKLS